MTSRRVLLIYAPTEWPRPHAYGLSMLMAVLQEAGHEVTYLDGHFTPEESLLAHLADRTYDVIGISAIITNYVYVRDLVPRLRRACPNAAIVCGGGLATAVPDELLDLVPQLDACFLDEAERSLLAFVETPDDPGAAGPGVVWRDGSTLKRTGPAREIADLNRLPRPDLAPVDLPRYFYTPGEHRPRPGRRPANRRAQVQVSRGCPNRCDFCRNSGLTKTYRRRDPEPVLAEIDELVRRWDVNNIEFLDDTFVVDPNDTEPLVKGLLTRGYDLTWGAAGRADHVYPELFEQMAEAGCIGICFGFDSFHQPTLHRMGKNTTVEDNLRAFRTCVECGIVPISNVLLGYDNETVDALNEDLARIRELVAWGRGLTSPTQRRLCAVGLRSFLPIFFATPYPGTSLYERNRARLPGVEELLLRFDGNDMDVLQVNVSQVPDAVLLDKQRELVSLVSDPGI